MLYPNKNRLIASCTREQKQKINSYLAKIPNKTKSEAIIAILKNAIAARRRVPLVKAAGIPYKQKHKRFDKPDRVSLQIAVDGSDYEQVVEYCNDYLPPRSRSRWIIHCLLTEIEENKKAIA